MKITIKNQEYKLLHNIPKGTRVMYNDEECVKAEKSNMLVGIDSGNIYALPPTKKMYIDTGRRRVPIDALTVGQFFVYKKEFYMLLSEDYHATVFNFNTQDVDFIYGNVEVELVQDKNIQIKVK